MHYAPGYDALLYIMTHYDALRRGYVNQLRRKSFHELCMRAHSLSLSLSPARVWPRSEGGGEKNSPQIRSIVIFRSLFLTKFFFTINEIRLS